MAIYTLPTFEDPFYEYAVPLEGQSYVFRFRYNQREDCWYLSIYQPVLQDTTNDLTPLQTGIKMVPNVNLIQRADVRLPPGELFVNPRSAPNNTTAPGLEELGEGDKRVVLAYVTSDDS